MAFAFSCEISLWLCRNIAYMGVFLIFLMCCKTKSTSVLF